MTRFVILLLGLTAGSFFTVWNNLQTRRLQYNITEAQKELRRERRSYKQVRVKFERLRSPVRLRRVMEERKLNLISKSKTGNHRLTPLEMKRVIRQRRLVSGKEQEQAHYAVQMER